MTTYDGAKLIIDPNDYEGMISLIERANEFPMPWSGKNNDGEETIVSINEDNITVRSSEQWLGSKKYLLERRYKRRIL